MNAVVANAPVEPLAPSGAPWQRPRPWLLRVFDTASTYLPLLLMAVLALGTWWLVKNTPLLEAGRSIVAPRHEPDYTMSQFMVQRFAPSGAMRVQIEGDLMRHYPDTDTFEVDNPRIRAIGVDGRVSTAIARLALSNRDGSEMQLRGGAHVVREATATDPAVDFRGEFLHYFQFSERVESNLPVVVTRGGTELRADAMNYDNLKGVLDLKGHVRAVLSPPTGVPR